jgi:peptidoglycan/LPS O-acetylase OafA/YrhL
MASKEKFLFLEPLRGIFALVVVIVHGGVIGSSSFLLGNELIVTNSTMLVDLFFQLSGFVIAYNYADRINGTATAFVFQFNRFLRMYPLHIVTFLCFAVGFPLLEYAKELYTGNVGDHHAFSNFDLFAIINNIFLTQGMFEDKLTYNYPSWSVSAEFYTYATFAIVFAIFSSKASRVMTSIVLVVIAASILHFYHSDYPETRFALFRCMYSFFLGVLLYYIYDNFRIRVAPIFVYLSFVLMFVCWYFANYLSSLITPFTYSIIYLSLLWSETSVMKRLLCSPKLVFLGTISYGIYMIHAIVWHVITRVLIVFFDYEEYESKFGDMVLNVESGLSTALLFFGTVVTIFLAYLSYRYLEMPFNNKRMKMPSRVKGTNAASAYVQGLTKQR